YQLTLKNQSSQPGLTFAIYTVTEQIQDANGTFPLAWQAKRLNPGNSLTFTWALEFSLMFSSTGAKAGAVWTENGTVDASDTSNASNSIVLDWNGDYQIAASPGGHPVKDGYIYLDTTAQIPPWSATAGPSVALAIATGDTGRPTPAIAGNSGPNLHHVFDLHPTYYIQAGQVQQGQMADLKTTTSLQKVTFAQGVYEASWILADDNSWRQEKV
ncbi:MAG: hypothetical protein ACRDSS_07185, partial [Actinocrinis sp.]